MQPLKAGYSIMNNWNGLDFFIFLIFVLNTLIGMNRGAAKEIISMMCLSVGLIFAIKFTIPLSNFFNSSPLMNAVVDNKIMQNFMLAIGAGPLTVGLLNQLFFSISLLLCFMFAYSICEGALSYSGFVESYSFPWATLSRKVGATLGCVRGYVFNLILLVILALHIFNGSNLPDGGIFQNSFFAGLFRNAAVKMDSIITGQQPESYREILKDKDLYKVEDIYKVIKNDGVSDKEGNFAPKNTPNGNNNGNNGNNGNKPAGVPNPPGNPSVTPGNAPASPVPPPAANTSRGLNITY
jgi:uncharacterized membrane protein required for colicin V production